MSLFIEDRIILDLCGGTGSWSAPYSEAGYDVRLVTMPEQDVRLFMVPDEPIHGILAAPPCDHFSVSGAQYWPAKDADGRTLEALSIVDACLRIIYACKPFWWALENPVGRLVHYIGKPRMSFNPCDYGDPYTKKTLLWGTFAPPPSVTGRTRACLFAGQLADETRRQVRAHKDPAKHHPARFRPRIFRGKSMTLAMRTRKNDEAIRPVVA